MSENNTENSIELKHSSEMDPYRGDYFYINNPVTMRWLPYKKVSQQFKKGIKGRFQMHNGYGWENTDLKPEKNNVKRQLDENALLDATKEYSILVCGQSLDDIPDVNKKIARLNAQMIISRYLERVEDCD